MKYLAAYLLLVQGGNASPSASDISTLLQAVGIEVEDARLSALLKDLEGKTIEELIAEGNTKLASVPSGGAAAGGASSGSAAGAAAVEEEKEEEAAAEESDDDMGMGLFD